MVQIGLDRPRQAGCHAKARMCGTAAAADLYNAITDFRSISPLYIQSYIAVIPADR